MRRKMYVVSSLLYMLLGFIIIGRSLAAHVAPLVILGAVFIALGIVRLRDFRRHQESLRGA